MSKKQNNRNNQNKNHPTNENADLIILQDENGEDVRFEILGLVEYENENYAVMLPYDEPEVNEVTILKVLEEDEETDLYLGIDDNDLIQAVFEEFKKSL